MPKRSLDTTATGVTPSDRAMKKTERSHEENQERAYIAASRRADRSIEARVQSARMASEIHKKRTGKGFKISEEIVMKEEMYEEEDDDLPRHYRALTAHLQTSSPDMNSRLSAYLTGQVAMASMARQKEIDKLFAESFPNAARLSQQMQEAPYFQGLHATLPPPEQSPSSAFMQSPTSAAYDSQSAVHRPSPLSHSSGASYMQSPTSQHRPSIVESPPVLSPESGHNTDASSSSTSTPHFTPAQQYHHSQQQHIAPQSLSSSGHHHQSHPMDSHSHFQSSFTSELPNDAKLLVNLDLSDPLAGAFYGMPEMDMSSINNTDTFDYAQFSATNILQQQLQQQSDDAGVSKQHQQQMNSYHQGPTDYFHALQPHSRLIADMPGQQGSRIGTPGGGEGDSWDNWIDENQWSGILDQR